MASQSKMKLLFATLLLSSLLLSSSFLETAMAYEESSASVRIGVLPQGLRIDVSSTVEYVVRSANAFLLEPMGTSMSALATGTSSTRRGSPNALDSFKLMETDSHVLDSCIILNFKFPISVDVRSKSE
ncbi:uncharacterized protein HKW66_Vig0196320 [Vigna angularis]|uniref:Uncharacterized protein n=1 Tax=Phaseolus angularis TaxID=3914 RepID=A0A8T0KQD1_PHAAN|nr:uncharacterized protein HKW66_Vig0196320 [Vigna angularis]